jgi:DNA-binding transcriptional LysR family regulator
MTDQDRPSPPYAPGNDCCLGSHFPIGRNTREQTSRSPTPKPAVVEFPRRLASTLPTLLGRLRFRHLALLAALDEHRNLHRASAAVHLAQPSATKVIHDLELLFGFPLFYRLPTGMQPTEPGAVVLGFARRSLSDLKRFAHDLDGRKAGRNGQLTIGTPMGAAPAFLAHATAEIKQRRPMLSVKMLGAPIDDIVKQLTTGHCDLAVGYFGSHVRLDAVHYESLGTEPLSVVVRKHHPQSRELRLNLRDLERALWILHPLANSARDAMDRDFVQAGLKAPTNVVETDSISATLSLLLTSDAVTILPESVVRDHIQSHLLIRLAVAIGETEAEFGILSHQGEPMSASAKEFADLLRRHAGTHDEMTARPHAAVATQSNLAKSRRG